MATITIPDKLKLNVKKIVKDEGFGTEEKFVQEAVEEKLHFHTLLSKKEKVKKMTSRIQEKMKAKGITEKDILNDFEKFKERLYK